MRHGKKICDTLKAIRSEIASANEIDYTPTPCTHKGDCAGTCPACESETRWLERQLRVRHALGKAVTIAGVSMALSVAASAATPSPLSMDKKKKTEVPNKRDERRTAGVVRMPPKDKEKLEKEQRRRELERKIRFENEKKDDVLRGRVNLNDSVVIPYFSPDSIFTAPDVEASFPGGEDALRDSINARLCIPDSTLAPIKDLHGTLRARCIVKALVEIDGTISDAVIEKTTTAAIFDDEALRVVKSLPAFNPAMFYEIPVRSWIMIPVEFVYDFSRKSED